jgi:hypothetical protein
MEQTISKAYRTLAGPYKEFRRFSRRSEFMWRYTCNLGRVVAYRLGSRRVDGELARLVSELDAKGIAMTTVDKLLPGDSLYRELISAVARLESDKSVELASARAGGNAGAFKAFNVELLDGTPRRGDTFERFASQPAIRDVADGYFGLRTTLRACNVWHTLVTCEAPRQSQLWHRDPEDRYILKMFVFLSDIDEGAGPFSYAAGSHMKGERIRNGRLVERHGLQDSEMADLVPPGEWVKCTGAAGTVVFADTRGYHKGGLARQHERLLFVSMFLSY